MRKRRRNIKPRFVAYLITFVIWVIAVAVAVGIYNFTFGLFHPDCPASANADITVEEVAEEKDYILDIPLSSELQTELHDACEEFGVDYYIMVALIDRETKFRNVIGDNGNSYGYCQIQPKWWYGLMTEIGATDLNIPKDNFRTACAIMSGLTKVYVSTEGALVAYNTGSYKGKSTAYSREIMANAERYRA
jgi:hypothetical protein